MTVQIKISVIVPIYNAAPYLAQCLESVISQSLKDIEIICVDDGSTDDSVRIVKEFQRKDPRIILIEQENQGAGIARNAGMRAARGTYLHFLDTDDFLESDAYERMLDSAVKNEADVVKTRSYMYSDGTLQRSTNDWLSMASLSQDLFGRPLTLAEAPAALIAVPDVPWNGIYRREFLERHAIRFNDLYCVNDHSFYIQLLVEGARVVLLQDYTVNYRTGTKHSLVDKRGRHFDCQIASFKIVQSLCERLPPHLRSMIFKSELSFVFLWYDRLKNNKEYGADVRNVMEAFVREIDTMLIKNSASCVPWLNEYEKMKASADLTTVYKRTGASSQPFVSVIVPAYNAAAFIRCALDSLQKQTLGDFEVICVDDASTDDTLEILKEYQAADKRFKVIHLERNSGAGVARNAALEQARGEYLVFLDADDEYLPYALELYYRRAKAVNADCLLDKIRFDGKVSDGSLCAEFLPQKQTFAPEDCRDTLFSVTYGGASGKCFKRAFIEENGLRFLPLTRSEDFCFVLGALARCTTITTVAEAAYNQRRVINPLSLEKTKWQTPFDFWEGTLALKGYLEREGLFDTFRRTFINATITRCWYNITMLANSKGANIVAVKDLFSSSKMEPQIWEMLEFDAHERGYFYSTACDDLKEFLSLSVGEYACRFTAKLQEQNADLRQQLKTNARKYSAGLKSAQDIAAAAEDKLRRCEKELKDTVQTLRKRESELKDTVQTLRKRESELKDAAQTLHRRESELKNVLHAKTCMERSLSFRLGRAATWLPRKVRGAVHCCGEHGVLYTLRYAVRRAFAFTKTK